MKLGCIFLFFGVLLISFQASDSVNCPVITVLPFPGDLKTGECSSCVEYACKKDGKFFVGNGCPEDFFRYCAGIDGVEFIKSKNYNDLIYRTYHSKFLYLSGCGKETDGTECIKAMDTKFTSKYGGTKDDVCIEAGSPCVDSNNGAQKMNGILGIALIIFAWIF